MVWIILAACALVALIVFVIEEIRSAPEVDDSYEVHLRDHYRNKAAETRDASVKKGRPRDSDVA